MNKDEIQNDIRDIVEELLEDGYDFDEIKNEMIRFIDRAIRDAKKDFDRDEMQDGYDYDEDEEEFNEE